MKKYLLIIILLMTVIMTACGREEIICVNCENEYEYNQRLADTHYPDEDLDGYCAFVVYTTDRGKFTLTYEEGIVVYVHRHDTGHVTVHRVNDWLETETYTEIIPIN